MKAEIQAAKEELNSQERIGKKAKHQAELQEVNQQLANLKKVRELRVIE